MLDCRGVCTWPSLDSEYTKTFTIKKIKYIITLNSKFNIYFSFLQSSRGTLVKEKKTMKKKKKIFFSKWAFIPNINK